MLIGGWLAVTQGDSDEVSAHSHTAPGKHYRVMQHTRASDSPPAQLQFGAVATQSAQTSSSESCYGEAVFGSGERVGLRIIRPPSTGVYTA